MRESKELILSTTNRHKHEEFQALFKNIYPQLKIIKASEIIRNAGKIQMVETHDDYLENAVAKARVSNLASHYPCLADDSGLEVEALNGAPGVKSRRFAIAKAGESQDQANINKLLEELKGRPMSARSAKFVCALALVMEGVLIHAVGELEGSIAESPEGEAGFGYDPVFIPKGQTRTLAQMSSDEKNEISHRAIALNSLILLAKKKGLSFAKP